MLLGLTLGTIIGLDSSSTPYNTKDVADIWINPTTKETHVLVEMDTPFYTVVTPTDDYTRTLQPRKLLDFTSGYNYDWANHNAPTYVFDSTYRGTLLDSGDYLYLFRSTTNGGGITVSRVLKSGISGAVDWASAAHYVVAKNLYGFGIGNAIWVESASHQTTQIQGVNVVFTGQWPTQDKDLWYFSGA